jgi:hypothetical protein
VDYPIELEEGEILFGAPVYQAGRNAEPFMFGISDRAIFVREKVKGFVQSDPWRFKRIPVREVRSVELVRLKPYGWYLLSLVFLVGAVLGFWPIIAGEGGRIYGAHFAALVGAVIIPLLARGRQALRIHTTNQALTFKPPFVTDKFSRTRLQQIVEWVITVCRQRGINVSTP